MSEATFGSASGQILAKPLHLQRLEAALDMGPFMAYAQDFLSRPLTSSDESEVEGEVPGQSGRIPGVVTSKEERTNDKIRVYNFSNVGPERKWLQDVLLSDTESESEWQQMGEDEYVREMLKSHLRERQMRAKFYRSSNNAQYGYYGAGLLSSADMFPEHQRSIVGSRKKRAKEKKRKKRPKMPKMAKKSGKMKIDCVAGELEVGEVDWDDQIGGVKVEMEDDFDSKSHSSVSVAAPKMSGRARKKAALLKTPEMQALRRRKVWQQMAKKELGKVQRAKVNNHKEMLTNCKRVATLCMKMFRQKAMQSQKNMKETVWRAKRLTREMQGYWKRYDRVERETRRRMEKEAEEQRKMDVELIEAKRQQRKLNFLITQTELYAHFMSRKVGFVSEEEQMRILNQLDEESNPRLAAIDDYNSELMKQRAQKNASDAFITERARTQEFDVHANRVPQPGLEVIEEVAQPEMFKGVLKGYQIKGMTWLANLYNQGISGILADEMGLGKTVQSIAFLCHIAEQYGVWGPFLIISPASTLHNWQQEMQRFVPGFNVVPYWGSPHERKILRQFWEQKDLHTKDASFHVVITSYQLVVSDYKYFNRIKWQYMVLDEAQAIKSSSSVRWKLLLGFNCRNRLLLSGTPIQNSMAELWALLHFIMPTLFDSHEEFNEWFSKDIESHAENKTGIDEKQISRLHMILKPFMLRRIKKDVENELSDKIEIMVYCPLTTRQKFLYMALKKKIRIEDLLHFTVGGGDGPSMDKNFTSSLMNLVMQFRKVCNHPELFERRDAKSPFAMKCLDYQLPRLVFDDGLLLRSFPSRRHLLENRFNVFKAHSVQLSLFPRHATDKAVNYETRVNLGLSSAFSFARFCRMSPEEAEQHGVAGLIYLINFIQERLKMLILLRHRSVWWERSALPKDAMLLEPMLEDSLNRLFFSFGSVLNALLFTGNISSVYTHADHTIVSIAETMEHRIIRSKNRRMASKIEELKVDVEAVKLPPSPLKSPTAGLHVKLPAKSPTGAAQSGLALLPEFPHKQHGAVTLECRPTDMPAFVYGLPPKVQTSGRSLYCDSRAARWVAMRHEQCEDAEGRRLMKGGLQVARPHLGWSYITIPDKQTLVSDAGKLYVLDGLLTRLKSQGHRVLIYSQMTKMIDLLEEYMWHRKHRYMRLDGSSKISARRDMVADFQTRADIFVFLLSTRAGGLGINLTAADTVIFYDSDWNPTVDQQAMDRAHRLGQTKQVTVYRLICKGTIEERILQRAREKSEIQRMVISGGNFKPDTLKPKEVVSLLLDDEEIELKYRQKTEERKNLEETSRAEKDRDRKRKLTPSSKKERERKKSSSGALLDDDAAFLESGAPSPVASEMSHGSSKIVESTPADDSSNEALVVDCDSPGGSSAPAPFSVHKSRRRHNPRGTKRGRPRGSRRGGGNSSLGRLEATAADTNAGQATSGGDLSAQPPAVPPIVRRGPGRPRLKIAGPRNQGYRGKPRPRKPMGPLVVPLGQSPGPTPPGRSPALSPAPSPAPEKSHGFYQPMNDNV
ncbi:chromatin-remodeling ATPase INO80 [Phlebotomus argentipes]|uniref:chromatin-remodeling ATPase INO80 n=1 Tax=Phlebotomus argentipes TaxID=94469 RepID=UPI0028931C3A|nr:chromatin-remodeling ATPase INO80 [Phlebotomus argentipes]